MNGSHHIVDEVVNQQQNMVICAYKGKSMLL